MERGGEWKPGTACLPRVTRMEWMHQERWFLSTGYGNPLLGNFPIPIFCSNHGQTPGQEKAQTYQRKGTISSVDITFFCDDPCCFPVWHVRSFGLKRSKLLLSYRLARHLCISPDTIVGAGPFLKKRTLNWVIIWLGM